MKELYGGVGWGGEWVRFGETAMATGSRRQGSDQLWAFGVFDIGWVTMITPCKG